MASGVTVANAFVQVMPSMEGATDNITNAILPSMTAGGNKAGATFGGAFTGKMGALLKGAGVAALGYLAFDTLRDSFVDVEAGFNNVVIATGATGEAAEQLKDVYLDVAGSVTGSFEEIGAAVGEINTRLGLNGEELEKASEQAMKFAKVNGIDATKGVQDVTRMMNNAGISADEYSHVLDVLTVAAQQSGIDVSKLAETVTQNAASFRELGFSTEESIAMLAQFEKAGVNSSQVLAGMKKGVAEWAKEGKSAGEGFAEFVQGVQDGSITSADAIELFGSRAGVAMYDAAATGQLSWDEMFATISGGSEGALDEVYKNTLTAQEKFDILGKKVQTGFYEIIEPIVDAIEPYMDDIIEAVSQAVDFIVEVAGPMIAQRVQEFIQFADLMVTTFGPVVQDIINFVQQMMDKFEEFRAATEEIFGQIEETVTGDLQDMSTIGSETVAAFTALMSGDFDGAAQHAAMAFDTLKTNITTKLNEARDAVKGIVEKIKSFFNFTVPTPNIPLPHFSISPSGWSVGDLLKGSIPSLGVSWHAKGGFVDGATLIGAGEAGPEMILPKSGGLMTDFAEEVAKQENDEELIRWLSRNLGAIIHDNAPTISRRDFDRMARSAIA